LRSLAHSLTLSLAHSLVATNCFCLSRSKGRGEQRIMKVYDSPAIPESEAVFQLTVGGISDVKD
jgi:meiotic recombination protein DMC1